MTQINGKTRVVGVLGWPVEHTLSPIMHNAAFEALKLNYVYIPIPLAPETIRDVMRSLQTFNFAGVNVTVPHKQAIMRYIDEIDPVAQNIGAVNTILLKDEQVYAYNTDCYGFLQSLIEAHFEPQDSRCLVLGAGGAARAVAYSLADAGAETIAIYNRTVERAAFLVEDLKAMFPQTQFFHESLSLESLEALHNHLDLVVNTTSLGMSPKAETSPWPEDLPLPQAAICDLVYNPLKTKFLQQAEVAGLQTIDGVGMLIHQGAKAFEIWTGQKPPTEAMREAVLQELARRG